MNIAKSLYDLIKGNVLVTFLNGLIVKGTTNNGTTKILDLKDSDNVSVASFDTNGNLIAANFSGINSGDQVGDGVTITGAGTLGDPFVSVGGGGGGSVSIISKTHAQLLAMKEGSTLVAGQLYKISDFTTIHQIPNTTDIHTGDTEVLVLLATSTNTLGVEVRSLSYPKDIIYYDIDDVSCEDGTWDTSIKKYIGGTPRKGKITYKKDTVNGLETYYDWRNVKFRRWAVDCASWVTSTPYVKYELIKGSDGNIYVCKKDITGTTNPITDTVNWQLWLDITTYTSFWSWTSNKTLLHTGVSINTANLIINNTTPGTDYNDYYTFTLTDDLTNSSGIIEASGIGEIGYGFSDIKIGSIDHDYIKTLTVATNIIDYNNIIFFLTPNTNFELLSRSNTFGDNCFNNTILNLCYYNTIKNEFHDNFISPGFLRNNIDNYFHSNSIQVNFQDNIIGIVFQNNVLGNQFYFNTIEGHFFGNMAQNNFQYNKINNQCNDNIFAATFNSNTIDNDFSSNTTLGSASFNVIGGSCQNNVFGNLFNVNIIGYNCSNNTIGSNFSGNKITTYFTTNIIANGFNNNNLASNFSNNTTLGTFSSNVTLGSCASNQFGITCTTNQLGQSFSQNVVGQGFIGNIIGFICILNTIGTGCQHNVLNTYFQYNTIGNGFASNNIKTNCHDNIIGAGFSDNNIDANFYLNIIGNDFVVNDIGTSFYSNTITNVFRYNTVKYNINTIDFTTATHVYNAYDCELFSRVDGTKLLKYLDNNNAYQIVSITA